MVSINVHECLINWSTMHLITYLESCSFPLLIKWPEFYEERFISKQVYNVLKNYKPLKYYMRQIQYIELKTSKWKYSPI